jgi:hypothetical protein
MIASTIPIVGGIKINSTLNSHIGANNARDPYITGFGFLQLANALHFAGDEHKLWFQEGSVSNGEVKTTTLKLKAGGTHSGFRAVLVWTDPASSVSASVNLVNNLDLRVKINGTVHLGNADFLSQTVADSKNNVESVRSTVAPGGTVEISVTGTAINSGTTQNYALVVVAREYETTTQSESKDKEDDKTELIIIIVVVVIVVVIAAIFCAVFIKRRAKNGDAVGPQGDSNVNL